MFSGAAGKGRFAAVEIAAPPPVRADAAQRVRTRRMHAPIHIGHMPDACRACCPATMRKMSQECLYVLPGGCRVNAKRCEAAQNIALRTAARKASTPARRTKTACPQVKDCLSRKRVEACLRGAPSEGAGRPDCVAEYCRCASGRGFGPGRSGGPAGLMLDLFRHPHPRAFVTVRQGCFSRTCTRFRVPGRFTGSCARRKLRFGCRLTPRLYHD